MSMPHLSATFTLTDTVPHKITDMIKSVYPRSDFMLYAAVSITALTANAANTIMLGASDVSLTNGLPLVAGASFSMGAGEVSNVPLMNYWVLALAQPASFVIDAMEA